jgi:hypothetical protein
MTKVVLECIVFVFMFAFLGGIVVTWFSFIDRKVFIRATKHKQKTKPNPFNSHRESLPERQLTNGGKK